MALGAAAGCGKADPKPNVLLVMIDTVRIDRMSVYGYERPTTPKLEALAADGVVFEQAITHVPQTLPSAPSLMTSLYPAGHGGRAPMLTANDRQRLERQAIVVQALARPIRLAIVAFLEGGEQCVCDIAEHVDEERSNVSRHLGNLLRVGVVGTRKEGVKVFYSLRTRCVLQILGCASTVLRQNLAEELEVFGES